MTDETPWSRLEMDEDPRLVVGWRAQPRRLTAARVELHDDTFPVLREIARSGVHALLTTERRLYEPFAELEEGEEHFEIVVDDDDNDGSTAELVLIMRTVDDLDVVDARDLAEQHNLFYAICWPQGDAVIAFVRKTDPARGVRHGRFFQYRDALRRVESPDLVLADTVDFVLHGDVVGILRPTPFRQLFADVDVALREVPTYVDRVRSVLAESVPLSGASAEALGRVVARRTSFAARLRRLPDRLASIAFTAARVSKAAAEHLDDPTAVVSAHGEFVFGDDQVGTFLDLAEGRLFEDDFSGEHRRADRWSGR